MLRTELVSYHPSKVQNFEVNPRRFAKFVCPLCRTFLTYWHQTTKILGKLPVPKSCFSPHKLHKDRLGTEPVSLLDSLTIDRLRDATVLGQEILLNNTSKLISNPVENIPKSHYLYWTLSVTGFEGCLFCMTDMPLCLAGNYWLPRTQR